MRDSELTNVKAPKDHIDLEQTVFDFCGQSIDGEALAKLLGIFNQTPFEKFKSLTQKLVAVPNGETAAREKQGP